VGCFKKLLWRLAKLGDLSLQRGAFIGVRHGRNIHGSLVGDVVEEVVRLNTGGAPLLVAEDEVDPAM
jgi:hypothetical protein